jgi:hypothetical protein
MPRYYRARWIASNSRSSTPLKPLVDKLVLANRV